MQRSAVLLQCLLCIWAAPGVPARADTPPEAKPAPSGEFSPTLDRLMKLPSSLDYGAGERGGMTPGEWRARYRALNEALEFEQKALEAAQKELSKIASTSDAWTLAAPIPGAVGAANDAPLDYQLHQEIQRRKSEIEHLERALLELDVRADFAGVPAEWRE